MRLKNFFKIGIKKFKSVFNFTTVKRLKNRIRSKQLYVEKVQSEAVKVLEISNKSGYRIETFSKGVVRDLDDLNKKRLIELDKSLTTELKEYGVSKSNINKIEKDLLDTTKNVINSNAIEVAKKAWLKEWERKFYESDVSSYGMTLSDEEKSKLWEEIEANYTDKFVDGWQPVLQKEEFRMRKLWRRKK